MTEELAQSKSQFKRILAATDGSEGATTALRAAIELAELTRAELIVLNVFETEEISAIHDPEAREFARVEHLRGDYAEAKEIMSESVLGDAKVIVKECPGVNASFAFLVGDPATQIMRYAEEVEADMIVMGRRGLNRLAGLLLGSVSQKVTSTTRRFVLIATPRN
jgi:nucleotide-binding universal stress UspA family protein